eukprot:1810734-Rhodomonas_salina.1
MVPPFKARSCLRGVAQHVSARVLISSHVGSRKFKQQPAAHPCPGYLESFSGVPRSLPQDTFISPPASARTLSVLSPFKNFIVLRSDSHFQNNESKFESEGCYPSKLESRAYSST